MSSEIKNKLFSSQLNTHTFHCLLCPSGHGGYMKVQISCKFIFLLFLCIVTYSKMTGGGYEIYPIEIYY